MEKNPYKVFHSSCELLRKKLHVILVRPEESGNVGSAARAMGNMGVLGKLIIVGSPKIASQDEGQKFAKHARGTLESAIDVPSLREAFAQIPGPRVLKLAATARIGSAQRPHPLRVREASAKAIEKLRGEAVDDIVVVFGPEGSGLLNEDVELCDWVVTIPSHESYRSLNLAQAVMVFGHELNTHLLVGWAEFGSTYPSQKQRLVQHMLEIAEEAGFILPGDPFKMKPRLEGILGQLPPHIPEVKTLHGLLDQVRRSLQRGKPDIRGRYRYHTENRNLDD